jgi:hypothetical protein
MFPQLTPQQQAQVVEEIVAFTPITANKPEKMKLGC